MKKIEDEQLKEIEENIKRYSKVSQIGDTEGGEELIKQLGKDLKNGLDELKSKYKTAPHIELVILIAKFFERLDLYRILKRAKGQAINSKKEYQNRLDELIG